MNIGDRIIHVLSEYRCTYTVDANGDGLELIDVLSNSSDDVSSGGQECDLLADDIHRAVTDYIGADDPKPGELARLRRYRDITHKCLLDLGWGSMDPDTFNRLEDLQHDLYACEHHQEVDGE